MEIKRVVEHFLIIDPRTRENDNLLIANVIKEVYGTTDMMKIANETNSGICETITRVRRKIQESNPMLAPVKVTNARRMKEKEVREWARKSI